LPMDQQGKGSGREVQQDRSIGSSAAAWGWLKLNSLLQACSGRKRARRRIFPLQLVGHFIFPLASSGLAPKEVTPSHRSGDHEEFPNRRSNHEMGTIQPNLAQAKPVRPSVRSVFTRRVL
jgi:hypothetical protein